METKEQQITNRRKYKCDIKNCKEDWNVAYGGKNGLKFCIKHYNEIYKMVKYDIETDNYIIIKYGFIKGLK